MIAARVSLYFIRVNATRCVGCQNILLSKITVKSFVETNGEPNRSMAEKPVLFCLRFPGLAGDWSKHNELSRNISTVRGFPSLAVRRPSISNVTCPY